jgi:hypothetical protein
MKKRQRKYLTWKEFWAFIIIVLILGWFLPVPSQADDITLTWTNPTNQETCTDAGATTIDGINIWQKVATIDAPATEYVIPAMKPGTYTYGATAFNADGESRLSGIVEKTVAGYTVQDERAYIVAKTNGKFLLLVVGSVPLGTPCDTTTEVNGYNAVPVDAVTFTGVQDVIVVAKCG